MTRNCHGYSFNRLSAQLRGFRGAVKADKGVYIALTAPLKPRTISARLTKIRTNQTKAVNMQKKSPLLLVIPAYFGFAPHGCH